MILIRPLLKRNLWNYPHMYQRHRLLRPVPARRMRGLVTAGCGMRPAAESWQ